MPKETPQTWSGTREVSMNPRQRMTVYVVLAAAGVELEEADELPPR
jgi:hypothetical protein